MELPSHDTIIHRWLKLPYLLHLAEGAGFKRSRLTVVFLHGIGANSAIWQPIIQQLPADIRTLSIDLLGYGQSPQPTWPTYNANLQANSVIATLIKAGLTGPVVIVGHSLGSLVAVEIAKRYRFLVKGLILCSPPFYNHSNPSLQEKLLNSLYQTALRYPDLTLKITKLHSQYPMVNNNFKVNEDNIGIFLATLEASIINQTSLEDITNLTMPIHIISGRFDPVVPPQNLVNLSRTSDYIHIHTVMAAHDITTPYHKPISSLLDRFIPTNKTKPN